MNLSWLQGDPDERRAWRCSIAMALILCGQEIAWTVRGSLHAGDSAVFPAIPVVVGMLMMCDLRWIKQATLYVQPLILMIPVLLLLLPLSVLTLMAFDDTNVISAGIYLFCLAAMAILIALNPESAFSKLPFTALYVGMLSCIAPLMQMISGASANFIRLAVVGNNNTIAVSEVAGITMIAALVVGTSGGRYALVHAVSGAVGFVLGAVDVFMSDTRSAMIFVVLCVVFYFTVVMHFRARDPGAGGGRLTGRLGFIAVVGGLIAAVPTIAAALFNPLLLSVYLKGFQYRITGGLNFFSEGSTAADASSSIRSNLIDYNWRNLDAWGHGVMWQERSQGNGAYPHLAYLHALYDLGYFGGFMFFFTTVVIPGTLIVLKLRTRSLTGTGAFIILYMLLEQGDQLLHGGPYSWWPLMPVVLTFALLARYEAEPDESDAAAEPEPA